VKTKLKTRVAVLVATAIAASLLAANATPTTAAAAASARLDGSVSAVDAVSMVVSDADRSAAFFRDVLTFETVSDVEVAGEDYERLEGVFGLRLRVVRMKLGAEHLELLQFIAPEGRPVPIDSRSNDRWFQHVAIIVRDMDQAYARLRRHKVRHASPGPQRLPAWNRNAGGIQAFYFKDPDGHALEILAFPPDKGAAKWHAANDRLFLGIDHTAIVVDDTDASLRFYRDGLGLKVAGESENYGIEQERLNNVFGARLRITGLTAGAGPGIEFLDYLAPDDGRAAPPDIKPNDLVSWQTRLLTPDIQMTTDRLRPGTFALISPGVIALHKAPLGFRRGALMRDPDGHTVMLAQK
jgi:catechol 2,3-dioxygenase-like lactoylglutathione lyase family enzyme